MEYWGIGAMEYQALLTLILKRFDASITPPLHPHCLQLLNPWSDFTSSSWRGLL